jgi:hypothetical protein
MKSGCYLTVALLAGLVLAEHYWLQRTFDWPELWIGTGILAVLSWFSLGALWNASISGGTLRALKLARDGALPQDGRWAAINGAIVPVGPPLSAPLSGKSCVVYEFELTRRQTKSRNQSQPQTITDFAGIGMAPCEIRRENEAIALYGFPDLDAISSQKLPPDLCRDIAQKYVRDTDWEDCSGFNMFRGFGAMLGALTSSGEEIRRNWRMTTAKECDWLRSADDPDRGREGYFPTLSEKRIGVGEPVIAVGVFDTASQSLATRSGTNFQRLQLFRGELSDIIAKQTGSRRAMIIGGLITLVIAHAIAVGLVTVYRNNADTQRKWRSDLIQAVVHNDVKTIERFIPDRLPVDTPLDDEQRTALLFAKDAAAAQALLTLGADPNAAVTTGETALMQAARFGRKDVLDVLIAARADVNRVHPRDADTALMRAMRSGHDDCIAALRAAGAKEDPTP